MRTWRWMWFLRTFLEIAPHNMSVHPILKLTSVSESQFWYWTIWNFARSFIGNFNEIFHLPSFGLVYHYEFPYVHFYPVIRSRYANGDYVAVKRMLSNSWCYDLRLWWNNNIRGRLLSLSFLLEFIQSHALAVEQEMIKEGPGLLISPPSDKYSLRSDMFAEWKAQFWRDTPDLHAVPRLAWLRRFTRIHLEKDGVCYRAVWSNLMVWYQRSFHAPSPLWTESVVGDWGIAL